MNLLNIILYVFSLVILVYLSGRFSGAETALTSLSEIDLVQLRHKKSKNVAYVEKLMKDMDRTIITILIGNNLVNILASSLSTLLFYELLGNLGVSISVGVLTLILLVFGEITPKGYALKKNRKMSCANAKWIYFLSRALNPLITSLKSISRGLIKLRGGSIAKEEFHIQEVSIKHLAVKGAKTGEIKSIEKDIIYSVFKFGDLKVKDAMIPAVEVKYLERKMSVIEAKKQMVYRGYTRIPVVNSQKMTIVGVVNTKDLLNRMEGRIKKFMRPPFIVSPEEDLTILFEKMRSNRVHLAIVSDENRKFLGIITLEDILEELVGEIFDEFDDEENQPPQELPDDGRPVEEDENDTGMSEVNGKDGGGDKNEEEEVVHEFQGTKDVKERSGGVGRNSTAIKEKDISGETIIRSYVEILGVEKKIAARLYHAGYKTLKELQDANSEELRIVEDITPTIARKIHQKLH